jgi:hypothetical protein
VTRAGGRTAALVATLALALAGCGGGGHEDVKLVLREYINAFADGDGKKVCSLMTAATRRQIIERVGVLTGTTDCAKAMEAVRRQAGPDALHAYRNSKIGDVEVNGNTAHANVTGPSGSTPATLQKVAGEWKVAGGPGS